MSAAPALDTLPCLSGASRVAAAIFAAPSGPFVPLSMRQATAAALEDRTRVRKCSARRGAQVLGAERSLPPPKKKKTDENQGGGKA